MLSLIQYVNAVFLWVKLHIICLRIRSSVADLGAFYYSYHSLLLKTYLLSMRVSGFVLLPELIPASQRMIKHGFFHKCQSFIAIPWVTKFWIFFFFMQNDLDALMQKDYEELAATLMSTVDLIVHKTNVQSSM